MDAGRCDSECEEQRLPDRRSPGWRLIDRLLRVGRGLRAGPMGLEITLIVEGTGLHGLGDVCGYAVLWHQE